MPHYIALIHKDEGPTYGISFPDVPGVITASDTLDKAISEAAEALLFAAEDWEEVTGKVFPAPRTLDELREDRTFLSDSQDAVIAAIPFHAPLRKAA